MTYATLMVHLELGHRNTGLLQVTGDLAERLHARVIGIATCLPMQMTFSDGNIPGEVFEQDSNERKKEMEEAEAEFRATLQTRAATIEWRSAVQFGPLPDYVAQQSRSADLLLTGIATGTLLDSSRAVNTGDLIMQAGRPVLVVPGIARRLRAERVLIGWKDTRETRRAVSDALPLLKLAGHVTVAEIAAPDDLAAARHHVEDVAAWLKQHGIHADCLASPATGDDAVALYTIAQDLGADILVAGAYGRSRLVEWVLGGVTRDLLLREDFCSLLSH